ncbi:MAG: endonuclease/exonuclease/phosphatase family protein [Spirulinaceae cyanobacterium]
MTWKRIFLTLSILEAVLCTLFSLAGYLGGFERWLELTVHFRFQYLVLSLILLIILAIYCQRKWCLLCLFCISLNAVEVVPWYINNSEANTPQSDATIEVMQSNILSSNQNYAEFIDLVRAEKPQILVVQELNTAWAKELESISDILPHNFVLPQENNFGMGIYSSFPLENQSTKWLTAQIPELIADVEVAGKIINLTAIHPVPPINESYFYLRNQQLEETSKYLQQSDALKIVLGDFNLTMWSPIYRRFIRNTGLVNARLGFGILPTWPTNLLPLRIPLDHCLVSPEITVTDIKVGGDVGSDHLPLIAELVIS